MRLVVEEEEEGALLLSGTETGLAGDEFAASAEKKETKNPINDPSVLKSVCVCATMFSVGLQLSAQKHTGDTCITTDGCAPDVKTCNTTATDRTEPQTEEWHVNGHLSAGSHTRV